MRDASPPPLAGQGNRIRKKNAGDGLLVAYSSRRPTRCQEGPGQAAWQSEAGGGGGQAQQGAAPEKLAGQSLRAIAAELDRRGIKSWSGNFFRA
jgi:hypothetical protein